jgi:hypothetical protein
MNVMKDDFVPVFGFENYEVNSDGVIRRASNKQPLKSFVDDRGYVRYTLWSLTEKRPKQVKVHRANWESQNKCKCGETIDHISGNKMDNRIQNLRCVSNKINKNNKTGTHMNNYKLTPEKKTEIQNLMNDGVSLSKIYKTYGIPTNYLSMVKKRGSWKKYTDGPKDL